MSRPSRTLLVEEDDERREERAFGSALWRLHSECCELQGLTNSLREARNRMRIMLLVQRLGLGHRMPSHATDQWRQAWGDYNSCLADRRWCRRSIKSFAKIVAERLLQHLEERGLSHLAFLGSDPASHRVLDRAQHQGLHHQAGLSAGNRVQHDELLGRENLVERLGMP